MEYRLPRKRTIAIVLGLTAIVFVSGSMVVSHFRKSPIGTVSLSEPVPELDRYVRNTSWETGYLSGVPYRKGDVLEFLYFADSKFPYAYEFDWDAFRVKFDIESVSDESGEISPESLEGTTFRKSSRLTIRAKAKTNGTTVSDVALRSELRKVSDEVLPEESSTGTLANTGSVTASGAVDASAFRLLESSFSADTNNALRIL
ncbi:MAG: hypothetical protein QG650_1180 [Patescibacteria group bacterium]|nr:hypothetical protein [Patescibacteria group bacterium]